jgi:hypothetical protein
MQRFLALLAAGLFAAGSASAADEAVTIKVKKSAPGDVVDVSKTEKGSNKTTFTAMGMERVVDGGGSSKFVYREEIIERPADARRATKLTRTYKTAEMTRADAKTGDLGLAGKTVLIEKKGDKYEFTVDGKPLTGPGAQMLQKEFGREKKLTEEDLFPKEPIKVGGTWKIDVSKLAKELGEDGMIVDESKSSASGKLIKTYDKEGARFGILEVNMDVTVTKLKGEGQEIPLKDSKMTFVMTADACIDGTLDTGKAKMTIKGSLSGEVMGMPIKIDLNVEQENSGEEVKKK